VATIELAIFINQGIPYFTGTVIPFVSPTIIGCVQLGATVDYAILMTTRFREEIRKGKTRKDAIQIAATSSDTSIITSSLVLFCATLGVGTVSKIEIISSICNMLARGAIISAVLSICTMPAVLYVCEPIFARTSRKWRTGFVPMSLADAAINSAAAEDNRHSPAEPSGSKHDKPMKRRFLKKHSKASENTENVSKNTKNISENTESPAEGHSEKDTTGKT
ncbi:MAG: MMPL family transporter, partial [Oscillospiraceae bacterium]